MSLNLVRLGRIFQPQSAFARVFALVFALGLAVFSRDTLARCAEAVHNEGHTLPELQTLADGVWWVSAKRGDADASNRGQVSNLLLVREGQRLWLLGSGPSPMWAQRLRCQISQTVGAPVTDVISPWAHPELVLGAKAFDAQHWAHADVAREMKQECVGCIQRLRQRLGEAAIDLGSNPVDLPKRVFDGAQGRVGPFEWHRLQRAKGSPITLWFLPSQGLLTAHGLMWAGGVPDLRDTSLDEMSAALQALQQLMSRHPAMTVLLGEQGSPAGPAEVEQQLAYLRALQNSVAAGQSQGQDGVQAPSSMEGIEFAETHRLKDPTHALNWQRAWRQAEDRSMKAKRN
jgi:hypothetical protein